MNPEADWKRVMEEIIGGLWQANVDWYKFTGQYSDAINYSKENFIEAAKEGKVLKIGIQVRNNKINKESLHFPYAISACIEFKTATAKLDNIQIQLLDPNAFGEYTGGKDWLAEDQEAFVLQFEDANSGNGALIFGVNEQRQLTIPVGSYYLGDKVAGGMDFEIGRFGNGLNEKYPSYFREDGLGVNADKALSLYFASMTDWLNFLPDGEGSVNNSNGLKIKAISMPMTTLAAGLWEMDGSPCERCWYLNPPVFTFAK